MFPFPVKWNRDKWNENQWRKHWYKGWGRERDMAGRGWLPAMYQKAIFYHEWTFHTAEEIIITAAQQYRCPGWEQSGHKDGKRRVVKVPKNNTHNIMASCSRKKKLTDYFAITVFLLIHGSDREFLNIETRKDWTANDSSFAVPVSKDFNPFRQTNNADIDDIQARTIYLIY